MKKIIYTLLFLGFNLTLHAQYVLVWADEFSTGALDPTKWTHEIGGNGWGNNEAQYYTNNSTNLSISGGELKITALAENYLGNSYTSAKISTKNLMEIKYGKIEARAICPMGQGLWPAFWMLGANITTVSWPACGEIDIMEHINSEMKVYGTAHWDNVGHVYNGSPVNTNPAEFHTYSIEWDSTQIKWLIDGSLFHAININNSVNGTNEFHQPFYLILNLAVGGNWPGYPNSTTVFPADFIVDYVRVYKDQSELGVAQNDLANFSIYPNPARDFIQLENVSKTQASFIRIVGMDGKIYAENTVAQWTNQIDVSNLDAGLYFAEVTTKNGQSKRIKFIKE